MVGRLGAFAVIPVLDLRHGQVVRARRGERASYAPIETPLAKGSAPGAVAAGLLAALPAPILYVADLDAIIDGAAPDRASLEAIARACPGTVLWVDAGFAEPAAMRAFLESGLGRPVIGSESQRDASLVTELGDRAVLSLDSRGGERLGPAALHADPALWPDDVIVMTLARIGAGAGPDLDGLAAARRLAPAARIYAAGGVRGPDDLRALAAAGIAGALVASAIHDGALRGEHLRDLP
ncbi:HisA/HisF-related TIM barrel protein [Methylobacterium dankookense]|uniref:Phosphoribosyl isomerase A n=1 Tax=Methylobacterium dankookense TaxID=560405 RepID=A0A564G6P8_9HYPH|nr:HisA/HisF-related TIM barrel protein [Methylobacterium dankookense]GJD56837.1 Phosphoribosyl isomerase A [Methylobacterium dankookense]VUF15732.1 Phosphoribosyl isomerase A [Methylobacterium dankookense]